MNIGKILQMKNKIIIHTGNFIETRKITRAFDILTDEEKRALLN